MVKQKVKPEPANAKKPNTVVKIYHKEDPNIPSIYKTIANLIQKQCWIFRGTNTTVYGQKQAEGFYYSLFDEEGTSAHITYLVQSLTEALEMGLENCPESNNGTRPLLIAVDATKYGRMAYPREATHFSGKRYKPKDKEIEGIEIREKIAFSDIRPITSLDLLNEFLIKTNNPRDKDQEAIRAAFQKHYL
jgi:hypothetical protein